MDKPTFSTRAALRVAARRLIAARGVDGVTVRDILAAAGVRNGGAISYYFGTKEDLIKGLIEKSARVIDERRNAMLDELESGTSDVTLVDAVSVLVRSCIGISSAPLGEDSYTRFVTAVQATHRHLYVEAVGSRWDTGAGRVIDHIRRLSPHVPSAVLDQRLMFMNDFMYTVLAKREGVIVDGSPAERAYWELPETVDQIIYAIVGLLSGPVPADAAGSVPAA